MSNQPVITYERIVTLNKVQFIPDARYKSGYRKREVVATSYAIIPESYDGTSVALNHVAKVGGKFVRTDVFAEVSFPLKKVEQEL
jgi:hypothetical protein